MSASSSGPEQPTHEDLKTALTMAPVLCAAMKLAGLSSAQSLMCVDALLPVIFYLMTASLDEAPFEAACTAHEHNLRSMRKLLDADTPKELLRVSFDTAMTNSTKIKELVEQVAKPPPGTTLN